MPGSAIFSQSVGTQRGAAARWAALSAESTKPAGATAGSNPVAPTYREPFCIKGSFLVCLNNSTLKFAGCQDYVKIFGIYSVLFRFTVYGTLLRNPCFSRFFHFIMPCKTHQ